MKDEELVKDWQVNKNPQSFVALHTRFRPIVNKVVSKYKNGGLPEATLRMSADAQLVTAFDTYSPDHGTAVSTHVWNHMQKVQRPAMEALTSGRIPEHRNVQLATFKIARDNLEDRLGREASVEEIADELGRDQTSVARMLHELGGETSSSGAGFDFYGNSTVLEHKDRALSDYLYYELSGPDKVIFEHTFGYGGKPILQNKEIAEKLGTNAMAITRAKQRMAQKIKGYR